MSSNAKTGWFSNQLTTELAIILKKQFNKTHDPMKLQEIGLNVARLTCLKELSKEV